MRARTSFAAVVLVLVTLVAGACDLPRDAEGTLRRVRGGVLRAGIAESPPWVLGGGPEPAGVEVDLVRELARSLGARVEWKRGALEQHLASLERHQLDLVAGALDDATPWKARVGLTRPFYVERHFVGARPGSSRGELEGLVVAVEPGTHLAHLVRERGARPLAWRGGPPPAPHAAAPRWRLEAWGLRPLGEPLHELRHVMAVPPGENEWLVTVERFLAAREPHLGGLLRLHGARP